MSNELSQRNAACWFFSCEMGVGKACSYRYEFLLLLSYLGLKSSSLEETPGTVLAILE